MQQNARGNVSHYRVEIQSAFDVAPGPWLRVSRALYLYQPDEPEPRAT